MQYPPVPTAFQEPYTQIFSLIPNKRNLYKIIIGNPPLKCYKYMGGIIIKSTGELK
jgi:hypothetical protein